MLFLDDFLEMLEELPSELRDRCKEIKDLDAEVVAKRASTEAEIAEYFNTCDSMNLDVKTARLKEIQAKLAYLRSRSEEKIALSERMQELLEKYNQHLEKEKMHLKYELEADNAGVTEVIEKRFADYVDQMFSMRKEKRRRPHPNTSNGINGGTTNGVNGNNQGIADDQPGPSTSRSASISLPSHPSSSKLSRLDSTSSDAASSPLPPAPRSRKQSIPLTPEETAVKEARREAIRQQLQASLHLKTQMNEEKKERGDSTWTPSSRSRPSPSTPNSATNQFMFSPSSPMMSPGLSSMPNFIATESRHGRARKLTSRVQEMFNSNQSLTGGHHRERSRHSSIHHPPTPSPSTTTSPSTTAAPPSNETTPVRNGTPASDEKEMSQPPKGSRNGDDGEDNDEKPYCFCNEKSYGEMVACDGKGCPYEWFHWPCVGLEAAPRGKWFCPHCEEKMHKE